MTNPTVLDVSFWSKLVQDCDLSVSNSTVLQYTVALADRFTTVEEFLTVDEKELISLGITDPVNRACLIKQARRLDEKENHPSLLKGSSTTDYPETWLTDHQSTPLNPKVVCNLSLGLLSRISFNDQPTPIEAPSNDSTNIAPSAPFDQLMETPERPVPLCTNDKLYSLLDSCRRTTPSTSVQGMRTIKSLSESISLQKKIITGTDRLKRLVITRSILKRRTAAIRKQMSDLKNKLLNPFGKMKISLEPRAMPDRPVIVRTPPSRMVISRSIKPRGGSAEQLGQERGKLQILSLNNDLGRSIGVASRQDPAEVAKQNVHSIPTLATKRFKLVAPTTFVTRSLSNRSHHD